MRTFAPVSDTRANIGGRACHSQARRCSEEMQSRPQCIARVTPQHRWHSGHGWHSGARVSLTGAAAGRRSGVSAEQQRAELLRSGDHADRAGLFGRGSVTPLDEDRGNTVLGRSVHIVLAVARHHGRARIGAECD